MIATRHVSHPGEFHEDMIVSLPRYPRRPELTHGHRPGLSLESANNLSCSIVLPVEGCDHHVACHAISITFEMQRADHRPFPRQEQDGMLQIGMECSMPNQ